MKSFFKKAILPVAVFGIAIAAAFATNMNKAVAEPLYEGKFYYHDVAGCQEITSVDPEIMDCTIQFTGNVCTWSAIDVYASSDDGLTCTIPLYKRTN